MTTKEIPANPSAHGLKKEVLSYGEVLAQSIAVIAPTTVPNSSLKLYICLFWKRHLAKFSARRDWSGVCRY